MVFFLFFFVSSLLFAVDVCFRFSYLLPMTLGLGFRDDVSIEIRVSRVENGRSKKIRGTHHPKSSQTVNIILRVFNKTMVVVVVEQLFLLGQLFPSLYIESKHAFSISDGETMTVPTNNLSC
jgi:hypothetical protein